MLRSLRFRLPALFLAGIVVAGIVSGAIAFRLPPGYSRNQSLKELRREAKGLTDPYHEAATEANEEGSWGRGFAGNELESATADRLYYVGVPLFPGPQPSGLRRLPAGLIDPQDVRAGKRLTFEFTPPNENRPFIAVG